MNQDKSQRKRRSDRYIKESGVAPSGDLLERDNGGNRLVSSVSTAPKVPMNSRYAAHNDRNQEENPEEKENRVKKLPAVFPAVIVVLIIAVMLAFTAQWLMKAYLTKAENERQQHHQRIVDAHPIYYKDIIEKYAAQYNLNPAYVCAIILNESSFQPGAESNVGAKGLMQVMPDTAEWIAGKLGKRGFTAESLYQPEVSIEFGCWYLNYLAAMFGGDPVLVTASYHTGQGQVKSWLQDKSISTDGISISIDVMPDGPTKKYVKKVTSDYGVYKALFYNQETDDNIGAFVPDN